MANQKRISQKDFDPLVKKLKSMQRQVTKSDLDLIGRGVVNKMVKEMKDGRSPITGRKFPSYKGGGAEGTYPNTAWVTKNYPGKRVTPVNLRLSGQQHRSLSWKPSRAKTKKPTLTIGYFNNEAKQKEQGHARGVNGQPKRPSVPAPNQRLSKAVQKKLVERFQKAVEQKVKKVAKK